MKTLLFASLSLLLLQNFTRQADAAVIAYDNFDYSFGQSVAGLSGGAGFNNTWSIKGSGSIYTTNEGITATPTANLYATRGFNTLTTGTYYFSFLVDNTNDGSRFTAFSLVYNATPLTAPTAGTELTYIGQGSGGSTWGINGTGSQTISPTYPASDRASRPGIGTTLMVLKVEFDYDGSQERLSLYINPTLTGSEPASPHITVSNANFVNGINAIWAGSGFDNASGHTTAITTYDNIRITTTWAELANAPEPSVALLGLLALTITGLRRQRRS